MDSILANIAGQLPLAVLIFIVVAWLLKHQENQNKCAEESREKEREFQQLEAEKQRLWNEDQGNKRDKFQRDLTDQTMKFIGELQKDQQKSVDLLNQSIQLVAGKTDLILKSIDHHHEFAQKSIKEIDKWRNGIRVVKKEDPE